MLKVNLTILMTFIFLSCASAPKTYPPLEEINLSFASLKEDSFAEQETSVTVYQIQENIDKATQALQKNNIIETDHYIYIANRKIDIANELLLKTQQETELEKLKHQQHEMIAYARRIEADRANIATQHAQSRVNELENVLSLYQVEETNRGTLLVMNDLLFDSGGASLQPESYSKLNPLLEYLLNNSKRKIIIESHTDSVGKANENKNLSERRANAVKLFFTERGIAEDHIETRGFGEEVPVATNTTQAGRDLNRRVEIVIKSGNVATF